MKAALTSIIIRRIQVSMAKRLKTKRASPGLPLPIFAEIFDFISWSNCVSHALSISCRRMQCSDSRKYLLYFAENRPRIPKITRPIMQKTILSLSKSRHFFYRSYELFRINLVVVKVKRRADRAADSVRIEPVMAAVKSAAYHNVVRVEHYCQFF